MRQKKQSAMTYIIGDNSFQQTIFAFIFSHGKAYFSYIQRMRIVIDRQEFRKKKRFFLRFMCEILLEFSLF